MVQGVENKISFASVFTSSQEFLAIVLVKYYKIFKPN